MEKEQKHVSTLPWLLKHGTPKRHVPRAVALSQHLFKLHQEQTHRPWYLLYRRRWIRRISPLEEQVKLTCKSLLIILTPYIVLNCHSSPRNQVNLLVAQTARKQRLSTKPNHILLQPWLTFPGSIPPLIYSPMYSVANTSSS